MSVSVKAVNEGLRDMKQAPTLSIITAAAHEIEATIGDFGARARDGKLTMDDMTGGTFTVSNGGVYG